MANIGSKLFCSLPEEKLQKIAAVSLGVNLKSAELLSGGLFNTTYRLDTDGGRFILRVGPVHRELLLYYETGLMLAEETVYRLMEENGIPGSHVRAMGSIDGREYMIVDYIDAKPLSALKLTPEEYAILHEEMVDALSALHRIRGDRFGRLAEVLRGRGFPDWYSHILHETQAVLCQGVLAGSFTPEEAEQILHVVTAAHPALAEVTVPSLCHGDLWGGNILVTPDLHLAAVIDLDRALYGDIDFDLGNPWLGLTDRYQQPTDSNSRTIRREIYGMMYFIFEAHAWHVQFMNEENARNGKKAMLERAERILRLV